jgi:capsular exopolysaccharide synthesis family protein
VEPLEYLRILRRRKLFVAITLIVGLVAGWVSAPGHTTSAPPQYRATHTLILNPSINVKVFNLDQTALLVTTGAVPQAVATKLGAGTDPIRLAKKISAKSNLTLGTVDITATDTDPNFAVALADDFAQALVDDLSRDGLTRFQQQHDELQASVNDLQAQLDSLQGTFDARVSSPARSHFDAVNSQYTSASARLLQLDTTGPPPPTFTTLQSAHAIVVSNSGLKPPDSKPARAALLGFMGLILGIGLAFAAERLETRLTTKISAEQALGLPVVAEIPNLPNAKRHQDELMSATQPAAPFVEAYRGLRTMVLLKALDLAHDPGPGGGEAAGKVLVVVSPGAGEGKTTTAAHLAALLAEAGNSVLVVSADFRRPRIHELFAVSNAPGLSEVLASKNPLPLRSLDLSTPVRGVKLLASGAPVDNPAPLLGATVELMRGARGLFDYIIVDTAPLLVANDASELIRAADMVLLVGRSHRTSIDSCQRSAELLKRIDAPVIGAVLVGASDMPAAYRYYRYRYYAASSPPTLTQRLRGRRGDKAEPPETDADDAPKRGRSSRRDEAEVKDKDKDKDKDKGGRRGQRGDHKAKRGRGRREPVPPADDRRDPPRDEPVAEPVSAPHFGNGASDPAANDEALSEFWQEFKERR